MRGFCLQATRWLKHNNIGMPLGFLKVFIRFQLIKIFLKIVCVLMTSKPITTDIVWGKYVQRFISVFGIHLRADILLKRGY